MEKIGDTWYIFYHRQTNRTNFCRQGCAEPLVIAADGTIKQVEVTSCGLNKGPLVGKGTYPARICCHLTAKKGATYSHPKAMGMDYPYLTQDVLDLEPTEALNQADLEAPIQYIKNIQDGATIGYKYFNYQGVKQLALEIRGMAEGVIKVQTAFGGEVIGLLAIESVSPEWTLWTGDICIPDGTAGLYLTYQGIGILDMRQLTFLND